MSLEEHEARVAAVQNRSKSNTLRYFFMRLPRLSFAAVLALCSFGFASTASAVPISMSFNLSAAPSATFTPILSGNPGRLRSWALTGLFAPFSVSAGDTVDIDISFSAPVTVEDTGQPFNGINEVLAFSFGISTPTPSVTYGRDTIVTLGGVAGDNPTGGTAAYSDTVSPPVTGIGSGRLINWTDGFLSFSSIHFSMAITSFSIASTPLLDVGVFTIADDLPAPAPGAIALFSLGLLGLVAIRRRLT